jgi:hypothetical protein
MVLDMTPKVVAKIMQVDSDTVVNWCKRGVQYRQKNRRVKTLRLNGYKIGGRWVIPRPALVAFLTQTGFLSPSDVTQLLRRA